jgi:uncharacterized protein
MSRIRRVCCVSLVAAALLLGAAAMGAQRLGLDARTQTLAPAASPSAGATTDAARAFGGDPVVILVRGPWKVATATQNLVVLATLEAQLLRVPGVRLVEGPGGLVYTAANAALDVALGQVRAAARAAGDAARAAALRAGRSAADADAAAQAAEVAEFRRQTVALLQTFPQIRETGVPSIDNPRFVNAFLFRPDGSVKPLYRQLFPRPGATLVVARLADGAGLTTVRRMRETVARVLARSPLQGVSAVVSGAPVVEEGLTRASATDLRAVLPVAGAAMLAVLLLLLPGRVAVLPLVVGVAGTVGTLGALDLLRRPTTLAAIAAVPILLGLITDYVVQLAAGGHGGEAGPLTTTVLRSRLAALALAAAATVAGALALLASPIPVVGSLGTVIAIGVGCGIAALVLVAAPVLLLAGVDAARGARPALQRVTARIGAVGVRRQGRAVLAAAVVAGVAGLALTPLEPATTDLRDFASPGLPAMRDLDALERATGAAGEVDVLVEAPMVAEPSVIAWMIGAERRLQRLLPAGAPPPVSLADLLVAVNRGVPPDARVTDQVLQTVPAYMLQPLVTPDATRASITLGIPAQDLDQQERLLTRMRAALQPPRGVTARLAGATVLAADGESLLTATSLLVDLLALAAVAAVLLLLTRSPRRAVVALVPMVLATGWTSLAVVALRIQLTPISAVLGALVVALATEFSVVWSARFREACRDGRPPAEAAALTAARTGSAIAVSGLTLGAGFLALAAGSSPLLRGFGAVAGLGVLAAVAAVLLLCPPLCLRLLPAEPAPVPPGAPPVATSPPAVPVSAEPEAAPTAAAPPPTEPALSGSAPAAGDHG